MLADCYTPKSIHQDNMKTTVNNTPLLPLYVETNLIHNVSGSAYLELGTTKVICSINGPYSSQRKIFSNIGQLECQIRYSFSSTENSSQEIQPHMIIDALQGSICLEKYPKAIISINLVILETYGYELGPLITCASLALIDASIEVIDLVCASSLSRIPSLNSYIPFPSSKVTVQGEICDTITVATIPTQNIISQIWFDGSVENGIMQDMINACCVFNKELRADLRKKLIEKISK